MIVLSKCGSLSVIRKFITNNFSICCSYSAVKMSSPPCDGPNCIFCAIIKDDDRSKILYEDEQVVSFTDIKPAAKFHYLIVSKEHIRDAKALTKDQKPLVECMVDVAKKLVEKSDTPSDCRFGFHWPPLHSVSHLHLHAISPTNEMSFLNNIIFRPNSFWFVSPEYVLEQLDKKP